jgi:hypothetical protein
MGADSAEAKAALVIQVCQSVAAGALCTAATAKGCCSGGELAALGCALEDKSWERLKLREARLTSPGLFIQVEGTKADNPPPALLRVKMHRKSSFSCTLHCLQLETTNFQKKYVVHSKSCNYSDFSLNSCLQFIVKAELESPSSNSCKIVSSEETKQCKTIHAKASSDIAKNICYPKCPSYLSLQTKWGCPVFFISGSDNILHGV